MYEKRYYKTNHVFNIIQDIIFAIYVVIFIILCVANYNSFIYFGDVGDFDMGAIIGGLLIEFFPNALVYSIYSLVDFLIQKHLHRRKIKQPSADGDIQVK